MGIGLMGLSHPRMEVASSLVPCSWQEGREEPAIDQMSTIVVKLERKEQTTPYLARQISKCFTTLPLEQLQEQPAEFRCWRD
jgi:hypothetical protein